LLLTAKFIGGLSTEALNTKDDVFFFIYAAMLGIPAILMIL